MQRRAGQRLSEPLSLGWLFVVVLAIMGMYAFFVAAHAAITLARMNRVEELGKEDGFPRHPLAGSLLESRGLYAAACRLGKAIAVIGLGLLSYWAAEGRVSPWLEELGAGSPDTSWVLSCIIVYMISVTLLFVFGELIPLRAVERNAEAALLRMARPIRLTYILLLPVLRLQLRIANVFMPMLGIDPSNGYGDAHTEADLRTLMKESHQRGYIDQTELTLVDNIFEFTDTTAREIMIPRIDMICLRAGLSLSANKAIAIGHMRTRYPVCEHDKDNITGFVHIKDLLKDDQRQSSDLSSLIRPVTTVPENIPISVLLKLMQKKRSQIAILIDEYGGTSGLVTLEDIMEQIVGDIQDEFDTETPGIIKREDGSHSISGLMLIEEVNSYFGTAIETDEFDTIGGWMYARVDFPPKIGQHVAIDGQYEMLVEETLHLRVSRLTVRSLEAEARHGQSDIVFLGD
jgi:CBS domain containing-hemolysin-like protein